MIEKMLSFNENVALNARPAAYFVKESSKFESEIWIEKGDVKVNGKSIMGIMSLASVKGGNLTVGATGSDEKDAVDVLTQILHDELNI